LHVVAVDRAFAAPRRPNEFLQLQKPLPGALYIDALLFRPALAKFAEAGDVARIDRWRVVRGAEAVAKRPLPLGAPHDAIDVIGTGIVLDQAGQEIPVVWIVDAERLGIPPIQISLLQFLDVRQVGAKHVLKPADDLHAALLSRREHFGQDIQVAMVGRTSVFQNRVPVVLGMRSSKIPAMKTEIVFLLAVVGQRLTRNLSSGDTSTISKYCEK
jgi:hypothetical protein